MYFNDLQNAIIGQQQGLSQGVLFRDRFSEIKKILQLLEKAFPDIAKSIGERELSEKEANLKECISRYYEEIDSQNAKISDLKNEIGGLQKVRSELMANLKLKPKNFWARVFNI